jgi:hypothetical protein
MATLDQTISILIGVGIVGLGMFVFSFLFGLYLNWKANRKVKIK